MEERDLGGVLIAQTTDELRAWWLAAIEELEASDHGPGRSERLVAVSWEGAAVGFYLVEGYDTASEGLAFSHGFFVLGEGLDALDDHRPAHAIAFACVGPSEIQPDERIGCRSVPRALQRRGLTFARLASLRAEALDQGQTLWLRAPPGGGAIG